MALRQNSIDEDQKLALLKRMEAGENVSKLANEAGVDAGDGETMDRVMTYTRARMARRIYALKGAAGNRPAIRASDTKGSRLFIVGVDSLKGQLIARLSRGKWVRFSDALEGRFYEESASERLVMRYVRGAPVRQWERIVLKVSTA